MFHFIYVQVSLCVFPLYGQGMYCMPSSRTCHRGCAVCHHPVPVTGDVLYAIIPYLSQGMCCMPSSRTCHRGCTVCHHPVPVICPGLVGTVTIFTCCPESGFGTGVVPILSIYPDFSHFCVCYSLYDVPVLQFLT